MSVGASGSDLPPALRSSRSPLPSEAPIRDVQFGDFANDEIATSQGPAVVLKTELNYTSANSIDFADQRICSAPFTPTRRRSAKLDRHGAWLSSNAPVQGALDIAVAFSDITSLTEEERA